MRNGWESRRRTGAWAGRRLLAAAAGAVLVLAAAAAPASAVPHSLILTGPSQAAVAKPTVLTASGTVSDDPSVYLPRYVNVYAIPAGMVSACPATYQNAIQLSYAAAAQGGDTVALAVPVEGAFSVPIAYTPTVTGRFWLCGYLHEGVGNDATASHTVDVSTGGSEPSPAASKPRSLRRPTVRRSGRSLRCSRGTWSGSPTRFSYSWRVDGKRKRGATRSRLRVTRSVKGRIVKCAVRAVNSAGATTSLSGAIRVR